MDKYKNEIKVQLSLKQKIDYYWWIVFFWTPTILTFLGGIYAWLFIPTHGDIKYAFYLGIGCFVVGLIGYIVLKRNLSFEVIETNLSKTDNYDLILKVKENLKWKKIKISKTRIVVSNIGYDISPGQLITLIPSENRIYFNCIHTTYKFTDPSIKSDIYGQLRKQIAELIDNK